MNNSAPTNLQIKQPARTAYRTSFATVRFALPAGSPRTRIALSIATLAAFLLN